MIYLQTQVFGVIIFLTLKCLHIFLQLAQSYTTGEIVNGSNSGATGVVQSISGTLNEQAPNNITIATPGVVEFATRRFKDGMQVTITGGNFSVSSS